MHLLVSCDDPKLGDNIEESSIPVSPKYLVSIGAANVELFCVVLVCVGVAAVGKSKDTSVPEMKLPNDFIGLMSRKNPCTSIMYRLGFHRTSEWLLRRRQQHGESVNLVHTDLSDVDRNLEVTIYILMDKRSALPISA